MTAQCPDILVHRGRSLQLCATPLADLLKRRRRAARPRFLVQSTGCWRGYVATWEIIDRRLYLTGLEDAFVMVDGTPQPATLATISRNARIRHGS